MRIRGSILTHYLLYKFLRAGNIWIVWQCEGLAGEGDDTSNVLEGMCLMYIYAPHFQFTSHTQHSFLSLSSNLFI